MKIADMLNNPTGVASAQGRDDRRITGNKVSEFQSRLLSIEEKNYDEKLRTLADQIFAQGEKLGERIDIRELKVYKRLVSEFLREAVGGSHKFSKESFLDRRGRYKVFATIKKINHELDELTKDVLKEEKDNIRILQRLDDIRGMILDIMM